MKSILIAKMEAPSYCSDGIVRALRNNFEEVYEFDYQRLMFDEGVAGMRVRLMRSAELRRPDVIFLHVQNEEALDIHVLEHLSKISFVVLYTFDVREDVQWYKEFAPHVGLILFGDYDSIYSLRVAGHSNVDYLQSSADFDLYNRNPAAIPDAKIVFIGNNYSGTSLNFPGAEERVAMVEFMKKNFNDRFDVYGLGWENTKMISSKEEIAAYNACYISITHNNFNRKGYTSDRLWRSTGCGAFTISQFYEAYDQQDFELGSLPFWRTLEELGQYCDFFLGNGAQHQPKLRQVQYDTVRSKHSWDSRIKQLKNLIQKHGYSKRVESFSQPASY